MSSSDVDASVDGYRLSDVGNAHRLIDIAEGRLRFVGAWNRWIVYLNGRWVVDHNGALVNEYAKQVALKLFDYMPHMADGKQRDQLFAHAKKCESSSVIQAMIHQARGDAAVTTVHEDLDADPYLLNCRNGTIDLRTGELKAHDPADLCTLQVDVDYDPDAKAELWDACLTTWQPDPEIRSYLQLEAGAGAVGHPTETLSVHFGSGGNGKSKMWGAVQSVLGGYACVPHKSLLVANKHEQHETVKADLFRRRLGVASETKATDSLDEEQVKAITGGDRMRARRMREDSWEFAPTHTLIVFTNHRPAISGTDDAVWRRVRLVPWEVTIPAEERDIDLAAKLAAESPGILAWVVRGAMRFIASGFAPPEAVQAATATYRQDEDTVSRFIAESLEMGGEMTSDDLRTEITDWCAANGARLTIEEVATALKMAGCTRWQRRVGGFKSRGWAGVKSRAEECQPS